MTAKRVAGLLALTASWLLGTTMGMTAAGLRTSAGRNALVGAVLEGANNALHGSMEAREISGSFLGGLVARGLVIREPDGTILAEISELQLGYGLRDILGGRIVLGSLRLTSPQVNLIKRPGRRLNLEEVLGVGGPGGDGRSPLIAFNDVEITDGTLIVRAPTDRRDSLIEVEDTPDGLMRVRRITGLNGTLPYVRISSPLPNEDGIRIDAAALRGVVSDPSLTVIKARGRIEVRGDSVQLAMDEVELPASQAELQGSLGFATGTLMLGLGIQARQLTTDDIRGLVGAVPAGLTGDGVLQIQSLSEDVLSFRAVDFSVEGTGGGGAANGELAMVLGPGDEWAFQPTRIDLREFDLEYIRGFFDTLPIAGRATGRFESDGPSDEMNLGLDVTFRDSLVEGWPVTKFAGSGIIAVGVPGEIVFRDYEVREARLDLGTVQRILPAVDLVGTLSGMGVLNGPWLEVQFAGDLGHADSLLPQTNARGTVRVDARRDTLGVWADLDFDSLSIVGMHSSYPQLADLGGSFVGRVVVEGYLDAASLRANLEGPAGAVFVDGTLVLLPDRKGASDLDLRVSRFNLKRLNSQLPETVLFGRLRGAGAFDSLNGSWSQANAMIRASSLEGVRLDSASVTLRVADGTLGLDTLEVWGRQLRMSGAGEIGLSGGLPGELSLAAANDSIASIEPLLESLLGSLDPVFREAGQPWGSLRLTLNVEGALSDFLVSGVLDARDVDRGDLHVTRILAEGTWRNTSRQLQLSGLIDSMEISRWQFADSELRVEGPTDSLGWFARTRFGPDGLGAWIAEGKLIEQDGRRSVPIDLMGFLLASGAWFVESPALVELSDSGIDVRQLAVTSDAGAGNAKVSGRFPFRGDGELTISGQALPVEDVWILLQRQYRNVGGEIGGTFSFSGARDDPTMNLSVSLHNARFERFQAPQLVGTLGYGNRAVEGNFTLVRTGQEIMKIAVNLPLDLSLVGVEQRRLPQPISVQARADGVDLSFLDAMIPSVRDAGGTLDANFGVAGTWENPELNGRIVIDSGVATFPGLGVTHEAINGQLRLSGDTIHVDGLSLTSGGGDAQVTGYLRLEELTQPILNLSVDATDFRGIELRDFLSLTATGTLRLSGPIFNATATGAGTVTRGVLYYADLISKDIINIEDTLYTEFVDTRLIRREGLGVAFQNRFLESLSVDSLQLRMGSDVWMRSTEANIQLLGDVMVNKRLREYRLSGTLQTARGTYRVSPGPSLVQLVATREFTVTRGEVTYLGTPDLNAAVDIEARHRLRSVRGQDVTVFVHIGGTVYEPRLTFTSDILPAISETEVLSYLFFGAPSVEALAGTGNFADQRLVEQGLNQFLGAVSGQIEYSLISDLKVPLDYLQIRPTGVGTQLYGLDVAVGKRLGEKWFLTVNPRVCSRDNLGETLRNLGASLEYRLSGTWLLLLSGDPVQSCSAFSTRQFTEKYQLGVDLYWEKRY
ncbi:MAG: hypothetical protein AMS18_00785 [Gemmatimonas sp. SG8_17]|nr:MAG: hypothetical protein AMS18_00785 [Gemmatimonas sp. SG8_17]